jgi:hypothetical protein
VVSSRYLAPPVALTTATVLGPSGLARHSGPPNATEWMTKHASIHDLGVTQPGAPPPEPWPLPRDGPLRHG